MKQDLTEVLVEQNPHWEGSRYPHIIKRQHDAAAIQDLSLAEIQIITGIRRCGKSTLMATLMNHLQAHVPTGSILYANFDDPNYTELCTDASNFRHLLTSAEKLTGERMDYILFDEIQNVVAWEKYIKSVYDSQRFKKIIISGSNADLLNSNYATLLSGRYIESHITPLCFSELLHHQGITKGFELVKNKVAVLKLVDYLLKFGGFPRIYCLDQDEQRTRLLQSYYETLLLKDCIANHAVRDTKTLMSLAHYLLSNIGGLFSYNNLSKVHGSNENTIREFIQILQNAYFIHELKQFSYSLKAQAKAKKKPYCLDNGLITATNFSFSANVGRLLENLVFSELLKKYGRKVYFYNVNKECDFIIHDGQHSCAIQVCYDFNPNNQERELFGLRAAMTAFAIKRGVVITYDYEEIVDETIQVIPFWKYFSGLLEGN